MTDTDPLDKALAATAYCGHPRAAIYTSGEGTSYCTICEACARCDRDRQKALDAKDAEIAALKKPCYCCREDPNGCRPGCRCHPRNEESEG